MVTPPGRTAKIHSVAALIPILLEREPLKLSRSGSAAFSVETILPTPPAMSVTLNMQIRHMTHIKQAKIKSVQATVFRPEGMTNSSATTAKMRQSTL